MKRIMILFTISAWLSLVMALPGCSSVGQQNVDKGTSTSGNSNAPLIQRDVHPSSFKDMLKFTISVDKREWRIGRLAASTPDIGLARLHVENSSDRDIEMRGPGIFHLDKRFSKNPRDRFYSSSALPGSTTTSSTTTSDHTIRRTWIRCKKGEHLDLVIDLGAKKWGRVIGAERPNQDFTQVIPPGNYDLFFTFTVGESITVDIPKSTEFESNSVNVVIK